MIDERMTREFGCMIERHSALINKVCYFYATDTDDFADMRQEALINIWRSLDRFKGEAKESTWIYRVTLNSCVSYFRHTGRHRHTEPIENHPELITDDTDKAMMIADMYALINLLGNVDKAIVLMWLDGNDYDTIASVVGMSRATVGSRLYRIKEKLVKLSKN